MKIKYLLLFICCLDIVLGLGRTPFFKAINERFLGQSERPQAIYISNQNNQAELLLNNKEDLQALISICSRKKYPVSIVYLELPNYELLKKEINNFIEALNKHNVAAYYIFNLNKAGSNIDSELNKFVSVNATYTNGFTGILLDYQVSGNIFSAQLLDEYLGVLEKAKSRFASLKNKLILSSVMPVSFGNEQLDEKYQPLIFNYIHTLLLTFHKTISEEDLNSADKLLAYAEEIKTECSVYLITDPGIDSSEKTSVYKKQLADLGKIQKKYKIFKTIALNYADLKNTDLFE